MDDMDRQQQREEKMFGKREPEKVRVQLRKVTKLVFCPNTAKLQPADPCADCPRFHGWFQDDDGQWVKCSEITRESAAIVVKV